MRMGVRRSHCPYVIVNGTQRRERTMQAPGKKGSGLVIRTYTAEKDTEN